MPLPSQRRTRRLLAATVMLGLAVAPAMTVPVSAQEGLPRTVLISVIKVSPENRAEFASWIADFRKAVDKLVADGRLSQTDLCAYKSWRVLGPDAAGLNEDFIMIFEPVIPIANYALRHYLELAYGEEEAAKRMDRYSELLAEEPKSIFAAPLDPSADAVKGDPSCDF